MVQIKAIDEDDKQVSVLASESVCGPAGSAWVEQDSFRDNANALCVCVAEPAPNRSNSSNATIYVWAEPADEAACAVQTLNPKP